MLEVLTTLLPAVGGGVFGALIKMWSMAQADKAEQQKLLYETLKMQFAQNNALNEHSNTNKAFNITRTLIALVVTSVLVGAFWIGGEVSIPVTSQEGGSYLWGLWDTTKEVTQYVTVDRVVLKDVLVSFQFIIGTYFGASVADRK